MERRRSIRIPARWELTLRQGNKVIRGTTRQFSEYGMLVAAAEPLQTGQRYQVSFSLPADKKVFELRAFAVSSSPSGVGLRFEFVPPEITAEFRRYVNAVQPNTLLSAEPKSPG